MLLKMHSCSVVVIVLLTSAIAEKISLETLNNYSEFLNFGEKKLKVNKESLENSIIKSKVDVLGEIFKTNIATFKHSGKLELIFLIDASSSVGESNFRSELKFVKKLLSDVTVDYNHTRVAIVTFSTAVVKNIDEITEPRIENNKCFLLNRLLNGIEYTGGGTYTLKAFEIAKEIFESSRNDSKKVLFLITDGFSNGGDPIALANELKRAQVTIFTIGIQNGNYKELYELASSPGELHSYLLDSFQEFESLARRALHVDLKSGDYIPLGFNSPCAQLCDDGDCCDKNALCTCGTTTGHYSCVCQPGFYGSGFRNSCFPCPNGSYSDGPNLCLPCPDMHHTTQAPAHSLESCVCKTGYQATKDGRCKILKCPKMSTPEHGYFVKKRDCGNVLNSACGIRCEVGYTLVGSSIRLCLKNASWSGDEPSCQVKTCIKLTPPAYGSMTCSHSDLGITYNESEHNLPVDTVCTFKCDDGKTMIGSSQRTCLPLARWDGLKTSCKQIKCPKLPPVKNGNIEPKSCSIGKQSYGKKCRVVCNPGFEIVGPSEKTCTSNHGLWDSTFESTVCKDVVKPNITCPNNITASTQPGKKFGTVSWDHPLVTDNTDLEVSVWMKPSIKNVTAFKFPIGNTQITYFAQDSFQNRAKCVFFVTIEDDEPPTIDDCDNPPTFLTHEGAHNISWDEPTVFDNSQHVEVIRSHDFGPFPFGTTIVTYTALDPSGNKNVCTINITVEMTHCDALLDPIYGRSECSPYNKGMQCVITCQEGYAVPITQPYDSINFTCDDAESVWYNQEGLMFPECSVTEIPKEVEQNGSVEVISEIDSCSNTDQINDLENDIKLTLKEAICKENCTINTDTTCADDRSEEKTNIIKRDIEFEQIPHRNTSRRRAKKKRINVKFQVKGKYINHTTENENINLRTHNLSIHYDKPRFICPSGFVPRKNRCVQCPRGTFHNGTRNRCQSCPFDSYSDELGQTECKSCPINHSTRKVHSKKLDDCREQCPPGTHARKKIIKSSRRNTNFTIERATLYPHCRSCDIGYYQPKYGQLKCHSCPKGYTTASSRSKNIGQCIPTSEEVCASIPNICNVGKCLEGNEYDYICDCPEDYIGPSCEKKLGKCDSNPCFNNGICEETPSNDFKCVCLKGFSGRLCEMTEEKCLLICLNNGSCHYTDSSDYVCWCPPGFGGDSCQFKLNFCTMSICKNNSTCVSEQSGYRCKCSDGFIGKRCDLLPCDYKPCKGNSECVNMMEVNATRNSYSCVCSEGYTGESCEDKINHCTESSCLNGGTCTSTSVSYTCTCPRFYYGDKCELKRKTNYVLNFHKYTTADYIPLSGFRRNLSQISACLWMQTKDNVNYGTLLSYATRNYDNAFTLTDYTGLVFYVNNEYVVTDVLLNDGIWHHVCITWNNLGYYKLYVDENLVKSGTGLAVNTQIEQNGNLVIGQEQDILGGRFSQSETFIGRMAHIDVWSKELSFAEISEHMNDCNQSVFGDVYGWPDVQVFVQGNIQIENSSFCTRCEDPKPLYNGVINIVDNIAYYDCYQGFYLSSLVYKSGRKCTKAAKWEGLYEPYCRKVYCGYPGYVRNGYTIGTKYYYQDNITYTCYDGYTLNGNSTITCTEDGTWFPKKPFCAGPQCIAFKQPDHSNLTILAEHSYEDFTENESVFDIGTQIEIICDANANLTGENVITCQENGTWDFLPPRCVLPVSTTPKSVFNCDIGKIPIAPENGYIVTETLHSYENGTSEVIEYNCKTGYKLVGDNSATCIIDGYWTEPNISCNPITCPKPSIKNMIIKEGDNEKYVFGTVMKLDCIEGYKIFGDSSIRCMANARWSRMRAKCSKKSCRKPTVNDATIIEGNSYLFEDTVTLICPNKKQYVLTCDSFGIWVGNKDKTC